MPLRCFPGLVGSSRGDCCCLMSPKVLAQEVRVGLEEGGWWVPWDWSSNGVSCHGHAQSLFKSSQWS